MYVFHRKQRLVWFALKRVVASNTALVVVARGWYLTKAKKIPFVLLLGLVEGMTNPRDSWSQ